MRTPTHCGCGARMNGRKCSAPDHAERVREQWEAECRAAGVEPLNGPCWPVTRVTDRAELLDAGGYVLDPYHGRR